MISEFVLAFFVVVIQLSLYGWFFTKHPVGIILTKEAERKIVNWTEDVKTKSVWPERDKTLRVLEETVIHHPISEAEIQDIIVLSGKISNYGYKAIDILNNPSSCEKLWE